MCISKPVAFPGYNRLREDRRAYQYLVKTVKQKNYGEIIPIMAHSIVYFNVAWQMLPVEC